MSKSLISVILIGAAVGFMMPGRQQSADAPKPVRSADARGHAIPVETRIRRSSNGHFFVDALVNGQSVHFVVDTGATGVALTVEDARRIGVDFDPDKFDEIGSGASGPVRGQLLHFASVELDGKERLHVSGAVLEGSDISLLGQSYLSRLNSVQMTRDEMILR